MRTKKTVAIAIICLVAILIGFYLFQDLVKQESEANESKIVPESPMVINENQTIETEFEDNLATSSSGQELPVQIANPASTNCVKVGGSLSIKKRGDGGEYGLCYFEDNRACEEWALMRGDCPVGGRRTTGFDTIDQNYCAWLGGNTFAVENSICIFKDGSECPTIDFYNGKCPSKED